MGDFEEYPLIFINSPASLQILASTEMALTMWRAKSANTYSSHKNLDSFLKQKFGCKEIFDIPVPPRIRAQINEKVPTIGEEMKKWIEFHSDQNRGLFDGDFHQVFSKCLGHIVVDFSGSICFKATAVNILNSGQFSNVENYKLACTFCLENQVRRFWPLVENNARIVAVNNSDSDHDKWNLSYWNECMKSGKDISIDDIELVKRQMKVALRWRPAYRRISFEDLFETLPVHERVSQTILFLWYPRGEAAICSLPLNRVQVEEMLKKDASRLFRILAKSGNYFQYAHQMWILIRRLILEDESIFVSLVDTLFDMAFRSGYNYKGGLGYSRCDQINELLLEIWSGAPAELKARVSDIFLRRRWIYFWDKPVDFSSHYGHDMRFLVEVLTFNESNTESKQRMWREIWQGLASRARPSYFDQLMRLCLSNDHQIEIYKNLLRNYNDLFRSLMEEGFYSDLKDYLMFCSSMDTRQFQELGKKVLQSNLDVILLHDGDKFDKFEWFVGLVFSNVIKDANEFKLQIVSNVKSIGSLIKVYHFYIGIHSSDDFSKAMNRFVVGEDNLRLVKRKLSGLCRSIRIDGNPEAYYQWIEFLKWCVSDGEEISASTSKQSLNIEVIFHVAVSCHLYKVGGDHLKFLDRFLKWYFKGDEGRKNFKLDKIQNYQRFYILSWMIVRCWSTATVDEHCYMYDLLKWFFDDDVKNLRKFCVTCGFRPPVSPPLCMLC